MRFLENEVLIGQPINKMPLMNKLPVLLAIPNNQDMSVWTKKIRIMSLTEKLSEVQNGIELTIDYCSTFLSTDERR